MRTGSIGKVGLGFPAAAVLLGLYLAACGTDGPSVGTQTNWLKSCQSDADCGELECLCGVCTLPCEEDATCAELENGSCAPASDRGVIALCDGSSPASEGLCMAECPSEGCPDGTSCVAGVCAPSLDPMAHVSVDTSERHQALLGIGAAFAYIDDEVMGHPRKEALYDAMFSNTGLSLLRLRNVFTGDEPLTGTEEVVDAARERLDGPLTIMLNSPSPPAALKASGQTYCEGNFDNCTLVKLADGSFDYAGFADFWRSSLEAYSAAGIEPEYISIQNNPNWIPTPGISIEACKFTPRESTETVSTPDGDVEVEYPGYVEALDAVLAEFVDLPWVPQIIAPETTGWGVAPNYTEELDFTKVAAVAHHLYGADPMALDYDAMEEMKTIGQDNDVPVFQSEMQGDGLATAIFLNSSFVYENATVFVQNNFVASANALDPNDQTLINLTEDDFELGDPYHVMLHYSAHISAGWVRVGATSDVEDVLVSAWESPDADALTLVLTNPGMTEQVVELDLGDDVGDNSRVIRTVLSGSERSADLGALPPEHTVTLPAQSLITVTLGR